MFFHTRKSVLLFFIGLRMYKRQAEIKAEFYDEMINVAEAKFKVPIRKKAGAKQ